MDPATYCTQALSTVGDEPDGAPRIERAQVRVLLTHFSRFGPPDDYTFARDLATLARSAEREGRRTMPLAAPGILADWEARRDEGA